MEPFPFLLSVLLHLLITETATKHCYFWDTKVYNIKTRELRKL